MTNDGKRSKDKIRVKPMITDGDVRQSAGIQSSQQILSAMKVTATIINPLSYLFFTISYFGYYYTVFP